MLHHNIFTYDSNEIDGYEITFWSKPTSTCSIFFERSEQLVKHSLISRERVYKAPTSFPGMLLERPNTYSYYSGEARSTREPRSFAPANTHKRESSLIAAIQRVTGTSSCLKILLLRSFHKRQSVSRISEPSPFLCCCAEWNSDRTKIGDRAPQS